MNSATMSSGQLSELAANPRPTDHVIDLGENRGADVEFQETLLSQRKASTRWTPSSRSGLRENHAVENNARPLLAHLLFPAELIMVGERVLPGWLSPASR